MPSDRILGGNIITDADPLQTQDMAMAPAISAIGATTDAPFVGTETVAARTGISLWKGIKNHIYDALGAAADAIVAAGAVGSISAKLRRATQGLEDLKTQIVLAAGTANIGDVDIAPIACASADVHTPAANTAAIVTYAASVGVKHCITGIAWSYIGGIPTGGNLKIEDVAGTTVFSIDIHEEGPGLIAFPKPKKSAAANTAMIITLTAGGAGITGKVSILNHWAEA